MKDNKNICVLFWRDNLCIGGIETYIYETLKDAQERNMRCGWIYDRSSMISPSFEDVINRNNMDIVCSKYIEKYFRQMLDYRKYSKILIITFDLYVYSKAELFRNKLKGDNIHVFFFVPHFCGVTLYPEEAYSGEKKSKIKKRVGLIFEQIYKNHGLICFAPQHIDTINEKYGIGMRKEPQNYVPLKTKKLVFDEERCRKLHKRERFNILTVSRFEFPHKGFVLGLIDVFQELASEYNFIELTIIGYGEGEQQVRDKLNSLPDEIRRRVAFIGPVAVDKLVSYYNDANLNISVAGCFSRGAKNGTLSLPARHYSCTCEVYGFLPESKAFVLSSTPGKPVRQYIEKVIQMSEAEYINRCKACFDAYSDGIKKIDITEFENTRTEACISQKDVCFLIAEYKKNVYKTVLSVFRKEGITKPILRRLKKI